jgi:hypothetical protein
MPLSYAGVDLNLFHGYELKTSTCPWETVPLDIFCSGSGVPLEIACHVVLILITSCKGERGGCIQNRNISVSPSTWKSGHKRVCQGSQGIVQGKEVLSETCHDLCMLCIYSYTICTVLYILSSHLPMHFIHPLSLPLIVLCHPSP